MEKLIDRNKKQESKASELETKNMYIIIHRIKRKERKLWSHF
jgi:hypothetical protein